MIHHDSPDQDRRAQFDAVAYRWLQALSRAPIVQVDPQVVAQIVSAGVNKLPRTGTATDVPDAALRVSFRCPSRGPVLTSLTP